MASKLRSRLGLHWKLSRGHDLAGQRELLAEVKCALVCFRTFMYVYMSLVLSWCVPVQWCFPRSAFFAINSSNPDTVNFTVWHVK